MKNTYFLKPVVASCLVSILTLAACGEGGLRIETDGGSATTQSTPVYDIRTAIDFEYSRNQQGYTRVQDEQRLKFSRPMDAAMYDRRFSVDFSYAPNSSHPYPLEMTISNMKSHIKVPAVDNSGASGTVILRPAPAPVSLRFSFRDAKIDTSRSIICSSNLSGRLDVRAVESGCQFDASNAAFRMDIPVDQVTCRLRIESQASLDFATMPVDATGMNRISFPSSLNQPSLEGKSFALSVFCHQAGKQVLSGHFLHNAYVAPY